jgi:serine/threonine protein phosphatase PrpC
MLLGFKAIAQGVSHIESGIPCQDAVGIFINDEKTVGIVIAADGHGSEKYFRSAQGSMLAKNITRSVLWEFYKLISPRADNQFNIDSNKYSKKFFEKNLDKIEQDIIRRWRKNALDITKNNRFSEEDAALYNANKPKQVLSTQDEEDYAVSIYGTTLIAAMLTPQFWFALQIGDGACVVIAENGSAKIAISVDESLAFGKTTSICDTNAASHFRHSFGFEPILGISVATDGVVDSFLPEKYIDFTKELREKFISPPGAVPTAERELQNFLPKLSERGSRDDVAIAGLWRV